MAKTRGTKRSTKTRKKALRPQLQSKAIGLRTSKRYFTLHEVSTFSGIPAPTLRRFSKSPAIRSHIVVIDKEALFPRQAFRTGNYTSVSFPRQPSSSSSVFVTSGSSASDIRSSLGIGSSEMEAAIKAILKTSS